MSAEKNLAPGSEREERLKKLEALKAAGINPYPAKSQRNYSIAQIFSDMEKLEANQTKVIIAGRLREVRGHGNLTFAHLEDASGRIQLAFSQKELGHESYKRLVKLIDSGDFLETAGTIFVTHSGEKSLMVSDWKVLSKAIAPIPNAWYGLKDEDERYRHRYLDILLNPEIKDIFYIIWFGLVGFGRAAISFSFHDFFSDGIVFIC